VAGDAAAGEAGERHVGRWRAGRGKDGEFSVWVLLRWRLWREGDRRTGE
jgi:hypothetical protein